MQTPSFSAYYLGCLNASGDRCSLQRLREEARSGLPVSYIDLNPGCFSRPWRVFVAGAEHDALEVLEEHCRVSPTGRIGRFVLGPLDDGDEEFAPFIVEHKGRRLAPAEDFVLGVWQVKSATEIFGANGCEAERQAKALAAVLKAELELVQDVHTLRVLSWSSDGRKLAYISTVHGADPVAAVAAWTAALNELQGVIKHA